MNNLKKYPDGCACGKAEVTALESQLEQDFVIEL